MTLKVSTLIGFFALLLPFVTASHWSKRHQEVAHRARGDVDIYKRQSSFGNVEFTWYATGLGACGTYSAPSDFIVALSHFNFGKGYPGPYCFDSITIQIGSKTAQATIVDECEGCCNGCLDFSEGLFSYFADTSEGVLHGDWWINGGSGGGGDQTSSTSTPPSTTWEPPITTSTPDYTPPATSSTPDYTPPPSTSSAPTYTPTTTTATTSTTSFTPSTSPTSSISSTNFSTSLASGLAVPTGMVVDTNSPENILIINGILVDLGVMLYVATKG